MLMLAGHREYREETHLGKLDILLEAMYTIKDVEEPKAGGGNSDTRRALPISHPGPADGQAEGEDDSER